MIAAIWNVEPEAVITVHAKAARRRARARVHQAARSLARAGEMGVYSLRSATIGSTLDARLAGA